ncbi:MAG: DUF1566 domain-containing protein [Rickettsiales bacterium]
MNYKLLVPLFASSTFMFSAQAALYDRGNGLIYDDVHNITWLQDANYAHTSGYKFGGNMSWDEALVWADQLEYAGYNQWRLPSTVLDPPPAGHNRDSSELGNMYVNYLGNSYVSGLQNTSFVDAGSGETVYFDNIKESLYWFQEVCDGCPDYAWSYDFSDAGQYTTRTITGFYAWAVHDGDIGGVSEVPLPAAAWLFGSALVTFWGFGKIKNTRVI